MGGCYASGTAEQRACAKLVDEGPWEGVLTLTLTITLTVTLTVTVTLTLTLTLTPTLTLILTSKEKKSG